MENKTELYFPHDFKDLQDRCLGGVKLGIVGVPDLAHIGGEINDPARVTMVDCYIMQIDLPFKGSIETVYCVIGTDGREYRSSSRIKMVDFTNGRILTHSGNVYAFTELLTTDPDSLTMQILGTLAAYGLGTSHVAGMPPVFF